MKDIKTKEIDRKPKVLEKASRMPKELAKRTMLEAKEKSLQGSRLSEGAEHPESPAGYASEKTEAAVRRMAEDTGRASAKASYTAGKKAAQKTYEKLRGQRTAAESGAAEPESGQPMEPHQPGPSAGDTADGGRERVREKAKSEAARKQREKGREIQRSPSGAAKGGQDGTPTIRIREAKGQTAPVKRCGKRTLPGRFP